MARRPHPSAVPVVSVALLAALFFGCGGGSSGLPSGLVSTGQTVAISIVAGQPAANVPIRPATITVEADRDLDPATVNTATVFVVDRSTLGGRLTGSTVTYDAATRRITWTLTQTGLNPIFPAQAVFAYDTPYELSVDGVKSKRREPQPGPFIFAFRTEPFALGIAASDPQAGTTTACVENFMLPLPIGTTFTAQVTYTAVVWAQVNIDLDPASVDGSTVSLEEVIGPAATQPLPQSAVAVAYDGPSRTVVLAVTQPQQPSPSTFSADPILKFSTPYRFRIGTGVRTATTPAISPGQDLTIDFTTATYKGAPDVPVSGSQSADVLVNEVLADIPGASTPLEFDANKDGTADAARDEFIEIVNLTDAYLDLVGHVLSDVNSTGTTEQVSFTFAKGTTATLFDAAPAAFLLPPRRALVVFCGSINRRPDYRRLAIDRSKILLGNRNSSILNNTDASNPSNVTGGETIRLRAPGSSLSGAVLSVLDFFRSSGAARPFPPALQSANRNPDGQPTNNVWVGHTALNPNAKYSAGTRADGTPFR